MTKGDKHLEKIWVRKAYERVYKMGLPGVFRDPCGVAKREFERLALSFPIGKNFRVS